MKRLDISSFVILVLIFLQLASENVKGTNPDQGESSKSKNDTSPFSLTHFLKVLYQIYPELTENLIKENESEDLKTTLSFFNDILRTLIHDSELNPLLLESFKECSFNHLIKYKDQEISDPMMKMQFERFLNIGELIIPSDERAKSSIYVNEINSIVPYHFTLFKEEILKGKINSLERDAELQKKWKSISESAGIKMKPVLDKFFQYVDGLLPYGERIGINNTVSLWKYLHGYDEYPSVNDIKKLWRDQLKGPYHQLMSYMRKDFQDLYTTYNGIEDDGPMPAYIFDSIFLTHNPSDLEWQQFFISMQVYNRLNILINTNPTDRKRLNTKSMTREIEKYYQSLGFPALEKSFWDNSIFIDKENNSDALIRVFYMKKKQKNILVMEVQAAVTLSSIEKIARRLFEAHQVQILEANNMPEIMRELPYSPFNRAFQSAIFLGTTSVKTLSKLGFLRKELPRQDIVSWYKGNSVKEFVQLASIMALNTWKLDVMDKKISIKKRMSEYWNRRLEYEWVVPTTLSQQDVNTSMLYDVFNGNHLFWNELTFSLLVFKLLKYQIHARLCELAGEWSFKKPSEKKLYQCDFRNSLAVAEVIRTVIENGGTKTWREQFDIIMGTKNSKLSAQGFLAYNAPLFEEMNNEKEDPEFFDPPKSKGTKKKN